jgi:hypothetical protein
MELFLSIIAVKMYQAIQGTYTCFFSISFPEVPPFTQMISIAAT